jgi:anaphase-promoting complex subunit 1
MLDVKHLDDRLPAWPIDMSAVLFGRINNPEWSLAPLPRNLGAHFGLQPSFALGRSEPLPALARMTTLYIALADASVKETGKRAANALSTLVSMGDVTVESLGLYPLGLAAPIREAARTCQLAPSGNWQPAAYRLIDRNDLAEGVGSGSVRFTNDGYLSTKDTIVSYTICFRFINSHS